jgi:hypothetical protein
LAQAAASAPPAASAIGARAIGVVNPKAVLKRVCMKAIMGAGKRWTRDKRLQEVAKLLATAHQATHH